ncbi:MAG: FadR family transcriptional regulator [Austwickia sp.]|nr:FadR family transcriptional regulator [Actinomycetota bacterium]MCO5310601.1 FadR family transcriptional regulator [Austwickia sp.]
MTASGRVPQSLHDQVVGAIGTAICDGVFPAGHILSIDALAAQHGVSRPVVREACRVLTALGLVASRRRVGTVVQPTTRWMAFDPRVIRWRLASSDRLAQLVVLTELRTAIEPQAARLAAQRRPDATATELVVLAARLWDSGSAGRGPEFLAHDLKFHRLLLQASGNDMFAHLGDAVAEVLAGRHQYGLFPERPAQEALQWHMDVAQAVQRGDAACAFETMVKIVDRSLAESAALWERAPSPGSASEPSSRTVPDGADRAEGADGRSG